MEQRPDLAQQEIVETYVYGRDGAFSVTIENQSAGYAREFVLGEG